MHYGSYVIIGILNMGFEVEERGDVGTVISFRWSVKILRRYFLVLNAQL